MNEHFTFQVVPQNHRPPLKARQCAYLSRDRWDDWGEFCTQFYLRVFDDNGCSHQIGNVKIGQIGLKPRNGIGDIPPNHRLPNVPEFFEKLDPTFFSLGQEDTYYTRLEQLGDNIRQLILVCLRDVAFDSDIWATTKDEYVMSQSLLRGFTRTMVEGQYRRMAHGGARLTDYRFSYSPPKRLGDGKPPFKIDFNVSPESRPPTNVHVLIGRNGVGKTQLLALMTKSLAGTEASAAQSGQFMWSKSSSDDIEFSNLVVVSFSAFDDTSLPLESGDEQGTLRYSYIGLRRKPDAGQSAGRLKTPRILANEFVESLAACQVGPRRRRWIAAMQVLESDPIFRAAELGTLIEFSEDAVTKEHVLKTFNSLSSGHKLILLTITRLVETVEEKTLVLIDEPEAHLHPPLLSAFVRALSNLLIDRNGVAIVATHSPVILQEVPKSCVWILSRFTLESKAERPSIETFGENVGILSREVFQLELTQSGYHQLLEEAKKNATSYDGAVEHFDGQLGAEARAVLKAMFLEK